MFLSLQGSSQDSTFSVGRPFMRSGCKEGSCKGSPRMALGLLRRKIWTPACGGKGGGGVWGEEEEEAKES